jgi:ABC-type arginine/histidine transport system permease subunit
MAMFSVEFSASAVIAVLLIVLDKMGKLTFSVLVILFLVAVALAIHPAISNPWIKAAPSFSWKCWRVGFCLASIFLIFSALGIWIFSGKVNAEIASTRSPIIQPCNAPR